MRSLPELNIVGGGSMARLRLEDRERVRAFWRGQSEAWRLSGLTQREYCALHGISLKNFGNWRGQLKREDAAGSRARWGRFPRLRYRSGPISKTVSKPAPEHAAPELPAPPGGRRQFSAEAKRRIVEETCLPKMSVSAVARRYGIRSSLLFRWRRELGVEPLPARATFLPVEIMAAGAPGGDPPCPSEPQPAATAPIIIERPAPGIEVELRCGRRVRFARDTDPETVKRMITALEGTET